MATLHQAIETTRNVFKWGGILLGSIFLILTLIRGGIFVKELFFPTPGPMPTVKFGVLPKLELPQSVSTGKYTYSINTVSGFLPTLPDRFDVYQIYHGDPNLLDLKRARSIAFALGVSADDNRISDTVYSWYKADPFPRKVVMDIVSRNFIYTTDFLSYSPLVSSHVFMEPNEAIKAAQDFLSGAGLLTNNIGRTKTTLYKIADNKVVPADSVSESQLVRVDFLFNDLNKTPVYSNTPNSSSINLLVSNFRNGTVVEANYYNHSITRVLSTYPIKTSPEAYKELQDGKAYIASFNPLITHIKIRNVFLAYYLSDKRTDYLMPIIVFTDNEGFNAYVPAITSNWVK